MSNLGRLWAGRAYGTNVGNLFVDFDETDPSKLSGTLRFLDINFGIAVYNITGTFSDRLTLTGRWKEGGEPEPHGELTIDGQLTSDGNLRGTWKSTIGTGGTFELFPHDVLRPTTPPASPDAPPEQLYTRSLVIGALTLYPQDILDLLRIVQEDFAAPRPVVTYYVRGSQVTKYATEFVRELSTLGRLDYLKIAVQEPEAHGISRLVVVELRAFGENEVRAQGIRESWVVGRAETLAAFLRKHESSLVTSYRKFGLNINSVIFMAMLVVIPEIPTVDQRIVFVGATVLLLALLLWSHSKFIPNASLVLTDTRPNALIRAWPTILSWLVAATASLAAALVFYWLTNAAP